MKDTYVPYGVEQTVNVGIQVGEILSNKQNEGSEIFIQKTKDRELYVALDRNKNFDPENAVLAFGGFSIHDDNVIQEFSEAISNLNLQRLDCDQKDKEPLQNLISTSIHIGLQLNNIDENNHLEVIQDDDNFLSVNNVTDETYDNDCLLLIKDEDKYNIDNISENMYNLYISECDNNLNVGFDLSP